jgi:hypothetical protein
MALVALAAVVGALLGLGAAAGERALEERFALDLLAAPDVVALVGIVPIGADELERALDALADDRRGAITEADRERVLERLVDEELLVQAAVDAGLPENDGVVRRSLTDAMMAAIEAQADDETIDAAVESYLDWLRSETRVWVR